MSMTIRQRNLAILVVVNLVLIIGGWLALVSPQRDHASAAAAQEAQVQTQLATLKASAHRPHTQPAVHTGGIYALDTALPTQLDEPDLLLQLDRLAAVNGVQILSVAPQTAQASPANYTTVPINLSLNGTYFHITRFVHALRMLVAKRHGHLVAKGPLFAVTAIALTGAASGTGNQGSGSSELNSDHSVNSTVTLAAFFYGAVEGATAPAANTTTTDTTTTGG